MNKITQFAKSHWKKICFASAPIIYGVNYMKNEYKISKHMQSVCNDVKQCAAPKAKNVLVILNPVANKKHCEKMFIKYCEPVLHIAGYRVEILKTKHIGHAKSLIETLQKLPDVIVIAGGDGTSSEAITGLLRRNGESCPVLFLPLGERNETVKSFRQLTSKGKLEHVKNLSSCLLPLVQERVQYRNVLKYEVLNNEKKTKNHKPIFGLNQFSWGIFEAINQKKDKYWYFGGLRYHAAALISLLSNEQKWNISAKLICTPPCPGCKKCVIEKKGKFNLFPKLFASKLTVHPEIFLEVNKLCCKEQNYEITAKQVNIMCIKNADSFDELITEVIESFSSKSDFVKMFFSQDKIQTLVTVKSRTIELLPIKSDLPTYYIDGEEYDARAIKISFIPNAVKHFC